MHSMDGREDMGYFDPTGYSQVYYRLGKFAQKFINQICYFKQYKWVAMPEMYRCYNKVQTRTEI